MSAVFPVLLLPIVLSIRDIGLAYRRGAAQQTSAFAGSAAGVFGVIVALIGVQAGGLPGPAGVFAWVLFAVELAAQGLVLVLVAATARDSAGLKHNRVGHRVVRVLQWRLPWDRATERPDTTPRGELL